MPNGNPIIFAFCGAKGHGKDTAAEVLLSKYGFNRVSFADGLRKTVCTALREPEEYFTDPDKKEEIDPRTGKSRRYWLQWIGTQGFRALWENVWVSWWSKEIEDKAYPRVVVTDVRFPNELAAVRAFPNSVVIRVRNHRKAIGGDNHASEAHFMDFDVDFDLENNGSIESLQNSVEAIFLMGNSDGIRD